MEMKWQKIIYYFLFHFQTNFYFIKMNIDNHIHLCSVPFAGRCSRFELDRFFMRLASASVLENIFQNILALYCLNYDKDLLSLILVSLIHYL